jgi:predicted short-subunit dehydrogenase-like oxidoreductase (DUF2520 family)
VTSEARTPADEPPLRVRIVGSGRAGGSFASALAAVGWPVDLVHRDHDDPATGVDLVLVCLPDHAIAPTVARWSRHDDTVVAHCAGSLGLQALAGHPRTACVHPLVSLPDPATGAERLRGAWFGVAGDPAASAVVRALGGRAFPVQDRDRARYHAAAAIASNHLVALLGQVERVAGPTGVPLQAFVDLARGSLENVTAIGPAAALTGPVTRGDWDTVAAHLAAIPAGERSAYLALAASAAELCGTRLPDDLGERALPGRPDGGS